MKIPPSFYIKDDVVKIASELLGKYLFTHFNGMLTGGIITETEAYAGITDKASHAYGDKRTKRTEIMYYKGGTAYVYLCYGIHSLFNIVTNAENIPHAVLIRGIFPTLGEEIILKRVNKKKLSTEVTNGPGKVSKALGIHFSHSGLSLSGDKIWLEDKGIKIAKNEIKITKRIGIDYAGDDVKLPYRFILKSIPGLF
jgi:DNA-3-methyladenine glycosylase